MPTLTLQFVREKKLTSSLIAWFTQGKYSHVEAIWPSHPDLTFGSYESRVGSIPSGVWFRPIGYEKLAHCTRFHIPLTQAQEDAWCAFMLKQRGKGYNWRAIIGFIIGRDLRDPDKWDCSGLMAAGLGAAGVCLVDDRITPNGLALVVSCLPGVTEGR